MPVLERSISLRGPRFFVQAIPDGDGEIERTIMFVNHIDASTRTAPRPATREDSVEHAEAWAAFCADMEAQEKGLAPGVAHPWRPLVQAITPDDHVDEGSVERGTAKPTKLQERRAAAASAGVKA